MAPRELPPLSAFSVRVDSSLGPANPIADSEIKPLTDEALGAPSWSRPSLQARRDLSVLRVSRNPKRTPEPQTLKQDPEPQNLKDDSET